MKKTKKERAREREKKMKEGRNTWRERKRKCMAYNFKTVQLDVTSNTFKYLLII